MTQKPLLQIKDLYTEILQKKIIQGLNLTVYPGEIHAIMGPNGSGKSSLAYALSLHPQHKITSGDVILQETSIQNLTPAQCAGKGLFVAMQHPIEMPGVSTIQFLKAALNAIYHEQKLKPLDTLELLAKVKQILTILKMPEHMLERPFNVGYSGGEKKLNEVLQLLLLKPTIAILDEIDSGLDVDALQIVTQALNNYSSSQNALIFTTHYQRILHYLRPHYVHILINGKIVKSGDHTLAINIENSGYNQFG